MRIVPLYKFISIEFVRKVYRHSDITDFLLPPPTPCSNLGQLMDLINQFNHFNSFQLKLLIITVVSMRTGEYVLLNI